MSNDASGIEKPIFFIGPGRSGSTIISEFLMVHELLAWPSNYHELFPGWEWSNYLRAIFDNPYWRLCGEKAQLNRTRVLNNYLPRPAEAYPFWEKVTREEINFSRGFLLHESATAEEKRRIRRIFSNLVSAQRRQRLAVKLTGPGRIHYLQSIFPDAIFINIVRDTAATARSLLKVDFWQDQGKHKLWWTGAYSEDELCYYRSISHDGESSTLFQLNKILQTTRDEAEQCNANMTTIHYEDFVAQPSAVLNRILDITGLPASQWITEKLDNTPVMNRNRANQEVI